MLHFCSLFFSQIHGWNHNHSASTEFRYMRSDFQKDRMIHFKVRQIEPLLVPFFQRPRVIKVRIFAGGLLVSALFIFFNLRSFCGFFQKSGVIKVRIFAGRISGLSSRFFFLSYGDETRAIQQTLNLDTCVATFREIVWFISELFESRTNRTFFAIFSKNLVL